MNHTTQTASTSNTHTNDSHNKNNHNTSSSSNSTHVVVSSGVTTTNKRTIVNELYVPFRSSLRRSTWAASFSNSTSLPQQQQQGSDPNRTVFTIRVPLLQDASNSQKLVYEREDYDRLQRLFHIIDTAGRGTLNRREMEEFVILRCPAFRRRDDLYKQCRCRKRSTFDEIWCSVAEAGLGYKFRGRSNHRCDDGSLESAAAADSSESSSVVESYSMSQLEHHVEFGIEAWMVFCRLISLLQYQEAKRHFVRHQPREENDGGGDEEFNRVVVIDVHPPTPPEPLDVEMLLLHERKWSERKISLQNVSSSFMEEDDNDIVHVDACSYLPPPELDLNHCLLAAHEKRSSQQMPGDDESSDGSNSSMKVSLSPISGHVESLTYTSSLGIDFALTLIPNNPTVDLGSSTVGTFLGVRRKSSDFEWLHEELLSHKQIGGTLCGRIIPSLPKAVDRESNGVGRTLFSFAKSIYSRATTRMYTRGSSGGEVLSANPQENNEKSQMSELTSAIERYLNYLVAHPALSTSFPLNAVLKANQAGLDSAKIILQEINREGLSTDTSFVDKALDMYYSFDTYSNPSVVRSAAKAAVALKLHGILDVTGLPTASARLQHASLPKFDFRSLREINSTNERSSPLPSLESSGSDENGNGFENGVIAIKSELDDEYDLLPLPAPNDNPGPLVHGKEGKAQIEQNSFHYGHDSTFGVGGVSVDDDINKLREIIGNLDSCYDRLNNSCKAMCKVYRKRGSLIQSLFHDFSKFKALNEDTSRALSDNMPEMENAAIGEYYSSLLMSDELAWQASLSSSAVNASEDVRDAFRAARTATSAKAAAELAVRKAQEALEKGTFSDASESRAAEVRVEISQSHAIHSAVINHEAFVAKRRATMALAHDIRYWNSVRKRGLLETCMKSAKEHLNASRNLRKSWSSILDGVTTDSSVDSNSISLPTHSGISEGKKCLTSDIKSEFEKNVHISDEGHFSLSAGGNSQFLSNRSSSEAKGDLKQSDDLHDMTASMQSLVDGLMVWGGRYLDPSEEGVGNGVALSMALGSDDDGPS